VLRAEPLANRDADYTASESPAWPEIMKKEKSSKPQAPSRKLDS